MEAPPQFTGAYVYLLLAHGFARIDLVRQERHIADEQSVLCPAHHRPAVV